MTTSTKRLSMLPVGCRLQSLQTFENPTDEKDNERYRLALSLRNNSFLLVAPSGRTINVTRRWVRGQRTF